VRGLVGAEELKEKDTPSGISLAAKPKNSAMITSFPKGRQRVKSLQAFVLPLHSLGTTKTQKRQAQQEASYSHAQTSRAPARQLTSQSLGSRSVTGQSANNNTATTGKNGNGNNGGGGETHIKLLVRVRPTLSSETATQCI